MKAPNVASAEDRAENSSAIAGFLGDQLAAEDKRRESLEGRASTLVTVSGALVTLLLLLATAVLGKTGPNFTNTARSLLVAAAIAFVLAALMAIATNMPQMRRITDPEAFATLIPDLWARETDYVEKTLISTRLEQLSASMKVNDRKALVLLVGTCAQVGAILLTAGALIGTVWPR